MADFVAEVLRREIVSGGPISAARYMEVALGHPQRGYYMTRDPFGARGDFITAPEVSQMFGEMIGAWAADVWMQLGRPQEFVLLECGPGRGTLMADLLRSVRMVPGFLSAAKIALLEISPVLMARQREVLNGHDVRWIAGVGELPRDVPLIVVANEFLDALPFHSLVFRDGIWRERVIGYESGFVWRERDAPIELLRYISSELEGFSEGDVLEVSPQREEFVRLIAAEIRRRQGAALWVDYGYAAPSAGDSFQAMRDNRFVDVLSEPGHADLTSHVDFSAVCRAGERAGVDVCGPVTQGHFLSKLGISLRAQRLGQVGDPAQVKKDLHRLVDSSQMGELFKVVGMSWKHEGKIEPAGF